MDIAHDSAVSISEHLSVTTIVFVVSVEIFDFAQLGERCYRKPCGN
jgi:hypothetical protein